MRSTINRKKTIIKEGDLVENVINDKLVLLVDEVKIDTFSGVVISGHYGYRLGHFAKDWKVNNFTSFTGTSVTLFND